MIRLISAPISIGILSAISGCGESSGLAPEALLTYAQKTSAATTLVNSYNAIPYTDPAALPASGTVRYTGYVGGDIVTSGIITNSVIGNVSLDANFTTNAISGLASGFVDVAEQTYSGSLLINNGDIDRTIDIMTQYTLVADMNGTLTGSDGTVYVVTSLIQGDFVGTNAGAIDAVVGGSVLSNGISSTIDGGLIAQQ